MTETPTEYENIHGRRQGRGLRPYLLIVKLFAIAVCVGTLPALLALLFLHGRTTDPKVLELELGFLGVVYRYLIVPALCTALLMGLLLFKAHPRAFIRMRWLQVKLAIIVVCLPALHLLMRHWMHQLYELVPFENAAEEAHVLVIREKIVGGSAAALSVAVLLIILGRIKPRLWQDYGQTFSQGRTPEPPHAES